MVYLPPTNHVLYIPDGNRRFATEQQISLNEAYQKGAETLEMTCRFFILEKNFKELTYFVSNGYTRKRADESYRAIQEVVIKTITTLHQSGFFVNHGLRLVVATTSQDKQDRVTTKIQEIERETCNAEKTVRLLWEYDVNQDEQQAFETAQTFEEYQQKLLIPPIDLVIRNLEMRASQGPIYAMNNAQLIIIPKTNPVTTVTDLEIVWQEYERLFQYRAESNPIHSAREKEARN